MAKMLLLCLLISPFALRAQCGYQATLRTTKDYCLGSSLIVSSAVPMERIVWYKDGKPFDSALAAQSIPTNPITVSTGKDHPSLICSNDADIFYATGNSMGTASIISKNIFTGVTSTVATGLNMDIIQICTDHQGNLYVAEGYPPLIRRFPGDTVLARNLSGTAQAYYFGQGLWVDCQQTVYAGDGGDGVVRKYPVGDSIGRLVADVFAVPPIVATIDAIQVDSAGNLFVLQDGRLLRWAPGASTGEVVASWDQSSTDVTAMWMDGKDTIYVAGWVGAQADNLMMAKLVQGDKSLRDVHIFPTGPDGSDRPSITVDVHGNIYVTNGANPYYFEFPRTSTIDSAFTPTDTGAYYAIVTNIQGYAARTKTIVINDPLSLSGPPSIQISATATSTPVCTPITFTANVSNAGYNPAYQWVVSGVPTGGDSVSYSYNLFANGDQVYCILTAQAGCSGPIVDTSNTITLNIDPHGAASVSISTPKDSICRGDTAVFKATVSNGSGNPAFQWLIDGDSTGDVTDTLSSGNLSTGDVITCLITSDDACGLAKSNSIPITVSIPPTVESGQIFTVTHGHSVTLDPVTTGDIDNWSWTPPAGLSDTAIADPVASADTNTLYTLKVTAPGGCYASGTILVNVYIPVSIPGAFTPNGDGRNDRFYVLGGPVNSRVEELAVFDRYGASVFRVHGVAPGDPSTGWDGSFHGTPAPTGTYVYMVAMQFANGARQVYKGTLVLVR